LKSSLSSHDDGLTGKKRERPPLLTINPGSPPPLLVYFFCIDTLQDIIPKLTYHFPHPPHPTITTPHGLVNDNESALLRSGKGSEGGLGEREKLPAVYIYVHNMEMLKKQYIWNFLF